MTFAEQMGKEEISKRGEKINEENDKVMAENKKKKAMKELGCTSENCECIQEIFAPETYWNPDKNKGNLPPGKQIQRKKELTELERINKEGFRSASERQEIAHMAREYEKEKGMEVGSISSGVAKKHTREEVVLTGKKKKEEAIKKRRKSLGT
jgi:hypothetical protein